MRVVEGYDVEIRSFGVKGVKRYVKWFEKDPILTEAFAVAVAHCSGSASDAKLQAIHSAVLELEVKRFTLVQTCEKLELPELGACKQRLHLTRVVSNLTSENIGEQIASLFGNLSLVSPTATTSPDFWRADFLELLRTEK